MCLDIIIYCVAFIRKLVKEPFAYGSKDTLLLKTRKTSFCLWLERHLSAYDSKVILLIMTRKTCFWLWFERRLFDYDCFESLCLWFERILLLTVRKNPSAYDPKDPSAYDPKDILLMTLLKVITFLWHNYVVCYAGSWERYYFPRHCIPSSPAGCQIAGLLWRHFILITVIIVKRTIYYPKWQARVSKLKHNEPNEELGIT